MTVVTLLVTPEQSERLTLASTEGKIQLALRNPLDKTAPATPGINPAGCSAPPGAEPAVSGRGARRPVASRRRRCPAAPEPTVEMIRGDKRATEISRATGRNSSMNAQHSVWRLLRLIDDSVRHHRHQFSRPAAASARSISAGQRHRSANAAGRTTGRAGRRRR